MIVERRPSENIIFTSYASSRSRAIGSLPPSLSLSSSDPLALGRTHSIPSSLAWRAHGLACAKWPFGGFESREIPSQARAFDREIPSRSRKNSNWNFRRSRVGISGCQLGTRPETRGSSTARSDWSTRHEKYDGLALGVFLGGGRASVGHYCTRQAHTTPQTPPLLRCLPSLPSVSPPSAPPCATRAAPPPPRCAPIGKSDTPDPMVVLDRLRDRRHAVRSPETARWLAARTTGPARTAEASTDNQRRSFLVARGPGSNVARSPRRAFSARPRSLGSFFSHDTTGEVGGIRIGSIARGTRARRRRAPLASSSASRTSRPQLRGCL